MVPSAESAQVPLFGRTAAGGLHGVVEVLGSGWEPARRELASGVPGVQEAPQVGVGAVAVDGEDRPGDRVGEHALPRDGPAGEESGAVRVDGLPAGEFTGLLGADPNSVRRSAGRTSVSAAIAVNTGTVTSIRAWIAEGSPALVSCPDAAPVSRVSAARSARS